MSGKEDTDPKCGYTSFGSQALRATRRTVCGEGRIRCQGLGHSRGPGCPEQPALLGRSQVA